jgi:hypothetical protein
VHAEKIFVEYFFFESILLPIDKKNNSFCSFFIIKRGGPFDK